MFYDDYTDTVAIIGLCKILFSLQNYCLVNIV